MDIDIGRTTPTAHIHQPSGYTRSPLALARAELDKHFADKLVENGLLTRKLVSYQAGKSQQRYRWFKFKEAFSSDLVHYLLDHAEAKHGVLLDPFAGSGTSLFAAVERGMDAIGIELMPIATLAIRVRDTLRQDDGTLLHDLERWTVARNWKTANATGLNELRITAGAYSKQTELQIRKCLSAIADESGALSDLLLFALLCVLEDVSYTRKDGQFLRWDNRSGRTLRQQFCKGHIPTLTSSFTQKLADIVADEQAVRNASETLFESTPPRVGTITCHEGSCLTHLTAIPDSSIDAIVTSPPYCNRYDYTRTYALELAALGITESGLRNLRQQMLSCTVENKAKHLLDMCPHWNRAIEAADQHPLLGAIVNHLCSLGRSDGMNNRGVIRMVKEYFTEMACVIHECHRVLVPGGNMFMVNDNVRFAGCEVPVDLILSNLAERIGFEVARIMVLPHRKGNSSQQMGRYGRAELRKCVYHWRRAKQ